MLHAHLCPCGRAWECADHEPTHEYANCPGCNRMVKRSEATGPFVTDPDWHYDPWATSSREHAHRCPEGHIWPCWIHRCERRPCPTCKRSGRWQPARSAQPELVEQPTFLSDDEAPARAKVRPLVSFEGDIYHQRALL